MWNIEYLVEYLKLNINEYCERSFWPEKTSSNLSLDVVICNWLILMPKCSIRHVIGWMCDSLTLIGGYAYHLLIGHKVDDNLNVFSGKIIVAVGSILDSTTGSLSKFSVNTEIHSVFLLETLFQCSLHNLYGLKYIILLEEGFQRKSEGNLPIPKNTVEIGKRLI